MTGRQAAETRAASGGCEVVTPKRNPNRLVLLIHGLNGSAYGTWSDMMACLSRDSALSDVALDCYSFPTSLVRWAFFSRRASVEEIAAGLETYIKAVHSDKNEIILVGHSLGGIIARYFVLERLKTNDLGAIKGLVLIAVPNTGAGLAVLARALSWKHQHARQLCKGSKLLASLNIDWSKHRTEDHVRTVYVVGGSDAVVSPASAAGCAGASNVRTIIDHDHRSIIKPVSSSDLRFKVVKDFIAEVFEEVAGQSHLSEPQDGPVRVTAPNPADVLFDVYSKRVEPFYCERPADSILLEATTAGHVWLTGPSGVGKTTALRRIVELNGWRTEHIMLGSFQGASALELARQICNHLYERAGKPDETAPSASNLAQVLRHLKRAVRSVATKESFLIFVEEIPLSPGAEYSRFMEIVLHLTTLAEANADLKLVWVFSSIRDPKEDVVVNRAKFLSRVSFIALRPWTDDELRELCHLIRQTLKLHMDEEQEKRVITAARGSPRFVKTLFRQRRQESGAKLLFDEFLESVEAEFKYDE